MDGSEITTVLTCYSVPFTKKAKDKQKTTCQETRNPGRIEKSQRQGCKRN